MGIFRRLLIVLFLLLAQASALAHGFDHLRSGDAKHSSHDVCNQCLAAHDLDSALASLSVPLAPMALPHAVPLYAAVRSAERFLVFRPARAPPVA
jgi:hypothetical protein